MLLAKHLSSRALKGLKSYQYKSGGYTLLDDLHTPFWNYSVTLLPTWLAPNLITLSGLFLLVLAYLANAYYAVDYTGEAPRWAYLASGLSVIAYVNLDSLDGKQARRTKSSSPLGQLFDHGCDALSVHLLLANIACSLQQTCGWKAALGVMGVMVTWVLGQFEEYHTGVMSYGNGVYGIMEANYTIAAIHFVTFIKGPAFWTAAVTFTLPGLAGPTTLSYGDILLLFVFVSSMVQACGQLQRAVFQTSTTLKPEERGNKQLGRSWALLHLFYVALLLILGAIWSAYQSTVFGQCRAVTATVGISFALVASQMIMCHMSKEPFMPSFWPYLALIVGLVNAEFNFVDQFVATCALGGLLLIGYLHYVSSVVSQICDYLGIKCFTIPPVPKES